MPKTFSCIVLADNLSNQYNFNITFACFCVMLTLGTITFCIILGLSAGFIDAIAGGGGLIVIPGLLLCGVPPHSALGTNKISAFLGTAIALFTFSKNRLVFWKMVFYGVGFSLLGSWLGSLLALNLDNELLGKIILFSLPVAMGLTLLPKNEKRKTEFEYNGVKFWVILPLVCLLLGAYDGFFGPGTGTFLILGLHWILGMNLLEASANAKAFNLASNFSAAVTFLFYGAVYWPLAILLSICVMTGNWLGSKLAIKAGSKVVRRFLTVSLCLLLLSLAYQYFFAG